MIWNREAECATGQARGKAQLALLRESVTRMVDNIPWYRDRVSRAGLSPADLGRLDDLARFPFTTKADLREGYPFGMFAVKREEIIEIHTSSGTTGKPVVAGYTRGDIGTWSEVMARCLVMAGAAPGDVLQNCYGYGLFTGGLGVHYGAQMVGATVVPTSAGNTRRQVEVMLDFGTTILACTPSYALHLAEAIRDEGIRPGRLKLRAGCFGAEMWTEKMRAEIEARLGLEALNIYGLTEIIGPGVAHECPHKNGLHIFEDHFYPEIICPETGEPLPHGSRGELVLTSLTRQGTPMLRFRTRDITSLDPGPCPCGRTLVRMARITGRSDDMIKVRGVIVFPSQIEKALLDTRGIEPHYQIILTRPQHLDEVEVRVEVSPGAFSDEVRRLEALRAGIEKHIEDTVGVRVTVSLAEPRSLPRSEGKAQRIVDRREM